MVEILTLSRRVYQRQDCFLDMLGQGGPVVDNAGQCGIRGRIRADSSCRRFPRFLRKLDSKPVGPFAGSVGG